MTFDDKIEKKTKGIALQSFVSNDASLIRIKETDENLVESISLMAKQFGKALK